MFLHQCFADELSARAGKVFSILGHQVAHRRDNLSIGQLRVVENVLQLDALGTQIHSTLGLLLEYLARGLAIEIRETSRTDVCGEIGLIQEGDMQERDDA